MNDQHDPSNPTDGQQMPHPSTPTATRHARAEDSTRIMSAVPPFEWQVINHDVDTMRVTLALVDGNGTRAEVFDVYEDELLNLAARILTPLLNDLSLAGVQVNISALDPVPVSLDEEGNAILARPVMATVAITCAGCGGNVLDPAHAAHLN